MAQALAQFGVGAGLGVEDTAREAQMTRVRVGGVTAVVVSHRDGDGIVMETQGRQRCATADRR